MSIGLGKNNFTIADNPSIDLSVAAETQKLSFKKDARYSIQANVYGTDGTPQYEILGSNDDLGYENPYLVDPNDSGSGPLIMDLDSPVNLVRDDSFPFEFMKIRIIPNGNTTGTGEFIICITY